MLSVKLADSEEAKNQTERMEFKVHKRNPVKSTRMLLYFYTLL